MAKEIVDLTETFTDMSNNIQELNEGAKSRSEAVQNILSMVLDVFKDKQSLINVAQNNDLRIEIKDHITNMLDLINTHDPNYFKKFQIV